MCFFPFQREWLSCVPSVYPFQHLIGTVAETFIQVQSSDTELKGGGGGWNTWLKCLAVSFMPRREQQTNLPLRGSKPRSGLLDRCVITHYDCGVLTCRYASTHMTCSCGSSHGCTSVCTSEWGSAFMPWRIIKYSVIASSGWGVPAIYHPAKQQGCDIPECMQTIFLVRSSFQQFHWD